VTVHDRGYRSFAMALAHHGRGLDPVLRIQGNASPGFDAFTAAGGTERAVTPGAPRDGPSLRGRTLHVRPVRYVAGDTEFRLAASLHDGGRFDVRALSGLHHGRWGTGEMCRTGKSVIGWFRTKSVRGVRREPCAAFTPVTPARRLSSRCGGDINAGGGEEGLPAMRADFRNGPRPVGRETGALSMGQADAVRQSVARIMTGLSRRIQRGRPGRGHPRRSMRPGSRWIRRTSA